MAFSSEKLFQFDRQLSASFSPDSFLVGLDEAGRGPLAGPVVAAAVVLPSNFFHSKINDSKKLSADARQKIVSEISGEIFWSVASASPAVIDSINILQATYQAMNEALNQLLLKYKMQNPTLIAIDGYANPRIQHPQKSCIKGDQNSACIAAASIFAKVHRDQIMLEIDEKYPQYGFAKHKGYGTALHLEQLKKHGPCPHHRRSFAPVSEMTR